MKSRGPLFLLLAAGIGFVVWRQSRPPPAVSWQGYVDADYVRVAPVLTGRLVSLAAARGGPVARGARLFDQDDEDDRAARQAARGRLAEAQARLINLETASRKTEIASAEAELAALRAVRDRIARDLARSEELLRTGAASRQTVDQQRADLAVAAAQAQATEARLAQLREPTGRVNEIAAQSAVVAQARAALDQAAWRLEQRHVVAPVAGLIADTFARPGEVVAAATPVVSLLPPQNILIRFFVPEPALAGLKVGQGLTIGCDGCKPGLSAEIAFIAPQPEYTPPVIYSEASRGKLVYLVEARPAPDQPAGLKPGQPVDVRLAAPAA